MSLIPTATRKNVLVLIAVGLFGILMLTGEVVELFDTAESGKTDVRLQMVKNRLESVEDIAVYTAIHNGLLEAPDRKRSLAEGTIKRAHDSIKQQREQWQSIGDYQYSLPMALFRAFIKLLAILAAYMALREVIAEVWALASQEKRRIWINRAVTVGFCILFVMASIAFVLDLNRGKRLERDMKEIARELSFTSPTP